MDLICCWSGRKNKTSVLNTKIIASVKGKCFSFASCHYLDAVYAYVDLPNMSEKEIDRHMQWWFINTREKSEAKFKEIQTNHTVLSS